MSGSLLGSAQTLGFAEICRSTGLCAEDIIAMVEKGLLDAWGSTPRAWRFPAHSLYRVSVALRLNQDLRVNLPGAALALDLLEELQHLRGRLRSLEEQVR